MNPTAYKLKKTFTLWDAATIGLVSLGIVVGVLVGVLLNLDKPVPILIGALCVPAMVVFLDARFFQARWSFWGTVEYVVYPDFAVRSESSIREASLLKNGSTLTVGREQELVAHILHDVIRFFDSLDVGDEGNPLTARVQATEALRGCVLTWRDPGFTASTSTWRDRRLSGLRKGKRVSVGWKPDFDETPLDETALEWELFGTVVNLALDIWGEKRVNEIVERLIAKYRAESKIRCPLCNK